MPFRCKCGRTYEKPDTFSLHTSSCAPFHQRRASLSNHVTYETLSSTSSTASSSSTASNNNNTQASTLSSSSSSSFAYNNSNNNNITSSSSPQIIPSTSISTSSIPPSSSSRRSSSIKISSPPSSLDMNFIRRRFSMNNNYNNYRFNSPEQTSATSPDKPLFDYPIFMPTALSIQNTFEGVRRRSMSYGAASLNQ